MLSFTSAIVIEGYVSEFNNHSSDSLLRGKTEAVLPSNSDRSAESALNSGSRRETESLGRFRWVEN